MTDNYQLYPQVRVSRKALEHLRKLVIHAENQRGYKVPMTAVASEIILAVQLPSKNGKGKLELPQASKSQEEG